jgi:hypothetical protein
MCLDTSSVNEKRIGDALDGNRNDSSICNEHWTEMVSLLLLRWLRACGQPELTEICTTKIPLILLALLALLVLGEHSLLSHLTNILFDSWVQ